MSHAANLRNRHRPSFSETSAKRRKISDSLSTPTQNGTNPLTNGTSSIKKLTATPTHNAKSYAKSRNVVPDAVVGDGKEAADVDMADASSDHVQDTHSPDAFTRNEDDESSEEDEDLLDGSQNNNTQTALAIQNGGENEEETDPSFGDLLRARNFEIVNVDASTTEPGVSEKAGAARSANRMLSIPSATSLGTVLTQALKTNDVDLLESCLQISSLESIRATVQRLHSSLATVLLQRLAERLYKRPGRAGSLMVWVQWAIVAHGGYLATQPATMKQIHTLYQVVKQRAAGLQPLLSLKGRLDMLEAQMQLRRNMQQGSRAGAMGDEDGTAVIYVEGEEEDEEDEGDDDAADVVDGLESTVHASVKSKSKIGHALPLEIADSDEDSGDMPMTFNNELDGRDDGDEVASGSSDEDEDLIDDEAEESEDDSEALSDEVDFDDGDEDDAEESEESEADERPLKRSTASQRDSGRRKQRG